MAIPTQTHYGHFSLATGVTQPGTQLALGICGRKVLGAQGEAEIAIRKAVLRNQRVETQSRLNSSKEQNVNHSNARFVCFDVEHFKPIPHLG